MTARPKTCACCGDVTAPLEQWHNQDGGFGLCARCAEWIESRQGAEYLQDCYGQRGVHIEASDTA